MHQTLKGLPAICVLLCATGAGAHGTAPIDQDTCVRYAGTFRVHYSAYQPHLDPKGHYCDRIGLY